MAPELINNKTIAVKDCIMAIGKSSWQLFAERARSFVSPNQVLEFNTACSTGYWKQELVDIARASLEDARRIQRVFPENKLHEKVLEWHVDLMDKLLQSRSQSLAAFHCLLTICCALALKYLWQQLSWRWAIGANFLLLRKLKWPLKFMYWRLSPAIRTLLLAYEQDKVQRRFNAIDSSALKLQRLMGKKLGDSRVIENVRQHGRDFFRMSKRNKFSNTSFMANALRSGGLNEREVSMVNADVMEKLVGKGYDGKGMANVTRSQSWTHCLFYFWDNDMEELKGKTRNASWISFLAMPGSILAQKSTGLLGEGPSQC